MLYAKTPHKSSDRAFRSPRTRNLRTPNRSFNQAFGNSAVSDRLRYAARPRSLSIQRRCFAITAFLFAAAQRSMTALGAALVSLCAFATIRCFCLILPIFALPLQRRSLIRQGPLGRTQKRVRRLVVDEKLRRVARPKFPPPSTPPSSPCPAPAPAPASRIRFSAAASASMLAWLA